MSIGKQVSDAIDKMEVADTEGALFAICAAIEATATREFSKPGRSSYKEFIHQNLGLITNVAFGGPKILNMNLAFDHPRIKTSSDGLCTVQDVFYHAVRCGLYHDVQLPSNLHFSDEMKIEIKNGILILPSSFVYGLMTAVVASPANCSELTVKPAFLNLRNFPIPINKLWGRRAEILWLLECMAEAEQEFRSRAALEHELANGTSKENLPNSS